MGNRRKTKKPAPVEESVRVEQQQNTENADEEGVFCLEQIASCEPKNTEIDSENSDAQSVSMSNLRFDDPKSRVARSALRRFAPSKQVLLPSLISQIGSLMKGTLASSAQNQSIHSPSPFTEISADALDVIVCAKFISLTFWDNDLSRNIAGCGDDGSLCLAVGYEAGFQIWSLSSISGVEISQLVSVRKGFGKVVDIDAVPYPVTEIQRDKISEEVRVAAPLLIISESAESDTTWMVKLYSLKIHSVVKQWSFNERVLSVKASNRLIAIAISSLTIKIFSALTLGLIATVTDAYPVFTVGTNYIIYASTKPAPKHYSSSRNYNADISSDEFVDGRFQHHHSATTMQDKAVEGIKKVTGKVVKEVLVGANYLSSVGYAAVSNYFNNEQAASQTQSPQSTFQQIEKEVSPEKSKLAEGVVAILNFPLSFHLDSQNCVPADPQFLSHWRPHTNKLANLTLNTAETLLFSSSISANTFYIFNLQSLHNSSNLLHPQCLYKLERGFTPASIESVVFSTNTKWCCVSTTRGTTHLYPIPSSEYWPSMKSTSPTTLSEIGVLNGWIDANEGSLEQVNRMWKELAEQGAPGGGGVIYPAARIKQIYALSHEGDDSVGLQATKLHRPFLSAGLVFDKASSVTQHHRKSGGGSIIAVNNNASPSFSITSQKSPSSFAGILSGGNSESEFVRLFRQRVFTMHPLGFVTLHFVDVGKYSVGDVGGNGSAGSAGFTVSHSPRSFRSGSALSPLDPSVWSSNAFGGAPKAVVKDIAHWDIRRGKDWAEYKPVLEMAKEIGSAWSTGEWTSQIETTTSDTTYFGPPIWMDPVFKIHVFEKRRSSDTGTELPTGLEPDLSDLPPFKALEIHQEIDLDTGNVPHNSSMTESTHKHIAKEISEAVDEQATAGKASTIHVWRHDSVNFDDADVVQENEAGYIQDDGTVSDSVHIGYFNKISNTFKKQ